MNSPARCVSVGFLLTAATLGIPEAWGANLTWQASSGDWSIASNWGGTLPTGIDAAYLMTGGTNSVTSYLYVGNATGSRGTYNLSGSGWLSASSEFIGNIGIGSFAQTD